MRMFKKLINNLLRIIIILLDKFDVKIIKSFYSIVSFLTLIALIVLHSSLLLQ